MHLVSVSVLLNWSSVKYDLHHMDNFERSLSRISIKRSFFIQAHRVTRSQGHRQAARIVHDDIDLLFCNSLRASSNRNKPITDQMAPSALIPIKVNSFII